jgi:hypothetical protein
MVLVSIHGLIDRLMILPRPLMIRSEKKLFAIEKDKTMPFGVCFGVRFQEPVFSPDLRSIIFCFGLSRRTIDNWLQRECRPGRYGKSR